MKSFLRMNGFALGLILAFSVQIANASNVHGILRVVKGDVQIKSSEDGKVTKAKLGGKVFPKDVVITGKESRAKIVMVDNNEINVSPESQIELQRYEYDPNAGKKEVLLNVIYGKVRSKVEQKYDGKTTKFQVKTPSAVAGVRGTDFITGYNQQTRSSTVITFEGRVEFGVAGPGGSIRNAVSVTPGTQASNTAGAAPTAPAPVPKEDLATMDSDTRSEPSENASPDERQPAGDGDANKEEPKDEAKEEPKAEADKKSDDGGEKKSADSEAAPGSDKKADGEKKSEGEKSAGAAGSGGEKQAGTSGDKKSGGSGPNAGSSSGRAPASAGPAPAPGPGGGGSMMRSEDFAGSANNNVMPDLGGPKGPTLPVNTPGTTIKPPTTSTTIGNDLISTGKGKLNITIQTGP